jgi:hypothetical protein
VTRPPTTPQLIVYGDFNCPYSYLASQRVDALVNGRLARVEWRAVEHDRGMPVTGRPTGPDRAEWDKELADVAGRALPGEQFPRDVPPVISSTRAAVSAFAEAVSDGLDPQIRRRLFAAIWQQQQNISSAYQVRQFVTDLMYPPVPLRRYRSSELATPVAGDHDGARLTRRLGGTIAPDGGPLTTAGYRRVRDWRGDWQALPTPMVPVVVTPEGAVHAGVDGLTHLARCLSGTNHEVKGQHEYAH